MTRADKVKMAVSCAFAAIFMITGVVGLLRHEGPLLLVASLLYIGALAATLRMWDSRIRYVKEELARLNDGDAARRTEYFIHMKQQILLARQIGSEREFREILESLLEMFGAEPDKFAEHITYVRGELENL